MLGGEWLEKLTNKEPFERIGEKRMLLNDILRRKTNWIGHILKINIFIHDVVEGQITEENGVGKGRRKRRKRRKRRRKRTQLLDDLRERRRDW